MPHALLPPHALTRLPGRTVSRVACPPFDSAVRKLPVRRQQAAHPLRVGGHLGLRLRWLWRELGSGDLSDLAVAPLASALAAAALAQPAAALAESFAAAAHSVAVDRMACPFSEQPR